ncbi:MAG: ABC transporter ATP-binding protein [Sphingobacteriales bacterium]|nr:ABC transporter ATP-binding protein [Sphingobacteriales bacterium]OJW01136.1 MAG: ABC transporter [Sphingobacteriales bacterium 44-61]
MKHLKAIRKYFWKYRVRLGVGIIFIFLSNYFNVLTPQVTGFVIDFVQSRLPGYQPPKREPSYDYLMLQFIEWMKGMPGLTRVVAWCGITILLLALLRGLFLFLMRQTIIVMSRHIEYDQKNEVYRHYQQLDSAFYKRNSTGDLMNRIAEDVSRVRMFSGPAIMYLVNLISLISLAVFFMYKRDPLLTLYVLAPLPILAITIYFVNNTIHKKSERIQASLSDLTTNAQESYSGIRVIKSFVQEKAMLGFFTRNSEEYRKNAIGLARVEAVYFPSITLLIGISTLLTIMIGGLYYINGTHNIGIGTIVEFVMYINMLMFPVSAIGLTASMIQRAAASQKRINEFLQTQPAIREPLKVVKKELEGNIVFDKVDFVYNDTGIRALHDFNLTVKKGQKVAIVGRTGSGKTTVAQLLLRMYDVTSGSIQLDGVDIRDLSLRSLREQVSYVPQDVFLFSETVENNIRFGLQHADAADVEKAALQASVHKEILGFSEGYKTMIGERGVTLSGGQKQRISIARALIKDPAMVIFDDCLSAVDAKTEKEIIGNLNDYLQGKTAIIITHRIFTLFAFDKIVVLEEGEIVEEGTHQELLAIPGGYYAGLYARQQETDREK